VHPANATTAATTIIVLRTSRSATEPALSVVDNSGFEWCRANKGVGCFAMSYFLRGLLRAFSRGFHIERALLIWAGASCANSLSGPGSGAKSSMSGARAVENTQPANSIALNEHSAKKVRASLHAGNPCRHEVSNNSRCRVAEA
jgi:hypothetical protein